MVDSVISHSLLLVLRSKHSAVSDEFDEERADKERIRGVLIGEQRAGKQCRGHIVEWVLCSTPHRADCTVIQEYRRSASGSLQRISLVAICFGGCGGIGWHLENRDGRHLIWLLHDQSGIDLFIESDVHSERSAHCSRSNQYLCNRTSTSKLDS